MNDSEFVRAVERCEFPKESFHHRDHIRLAWIYLRQCDRGEAERRMADTIRRFAAHHGVTDKYHETITLAWMRLVAHATGAGARCDASGSRRPGPEPP